MRLSQLIVLGVLLGLGAGWWLRRDAGEPVAASLRKHNRQPLWRRPRDR